MDKSWINSYVRTNKNILPFILVTLAAGLSEFFFFKALSLSMDDIANLHSSKIRPNPVLYSSLLILPLLNFTLKWFSNSLLFRSSNLIYQQVLKEYYTKKIMRFPVKDESSLIGQSLYNVLKGFISPAHQAVASTLSLTFIFLSIANLLSTSLIILLMPLAAAYLISVVISNQKLTYLGSAEEKSNNAFCSATGDIERNANLIYIDNNLSVFLSRLQHPIEKYAVLASKQLNFNLLPKGLLEICLASVISLPLLFAQFYDTQAPSKILQELPILLFAIQRAYPYVNGLQGSLSQCFYYRRYFNLIAANVQS